MSQAFEKALNGLAATARHAECACMRPRGDALDCANAGGYWSTCTCRCHIPAETGDARDALDDVDRCPVCRTPLSGNCEIRDETWPYCSVCSMEAANDSREDE